MNFAHVLSHSHCYNSTLHSFPTRRSSDLPKWQFEKFAGADTALGTQMKSVGEVMAIGRTFKEALQKGIRSMAITDRKSTRLNSSHRCISYAVFCLKKKTRN